MNLIDVLAAPGRSLHHYAAGTQDQSKYLSTLHDVYALMTEMHDEVLSQLNKARLSRDLPEGIHVLLDLSDPDKLTSGFRARDLCNRLEREGEELRRSISSTPGTWELDNLIVVLDKRERGAARFYVEELQPHVQAIREMPDFDSFRAACMSLRSKLLDQQAAFMAKADEALEMAQS
jgi:hypothetical protein